jgi:aspartyl-tRNA(Asn)/glutamyl-tRNA(Gln) amidotransferase subunit A
MAEPLSLTLTELTAGAPTGSQAVEASLEAIESRDEAINSFVEVRDEAPKEAAAASGPLAGAPIGLKDMFGDGGREPTVGSKVHGLWPAGQALVADRIRAAGGVIVGYTNLHEWGIGTDSSTTATGPIRNPWDTTRVAGGSSGGSAAAVAAGFVTAAVGTDAGGSIRIPSACCGVVGLKPTWGAVPMDGFVEGESELDHIGPITRSVPDARLLFDIMADRPTETIDAGGLRIGIARHYLFDLVDPDARDAIENGVDILASLVGSSRDIKIDDIERGGQATGMLVLAYTARLLGDAIDARADDFERITHKLLRLGRAFGEAESPSQTPHPKLIRLLADPKPYMPDETYLKLPDLPSPVRRFLTRNFFNEAQGQMARAAVVSAFDKVLDEVDVIVTPTLPGVARKIGDAKDVPNIALNGPMNLTGLPALSLPVGKTPTGLTVSLTLTAKKNAEDVVLSLGEALESALGHTYANRTAPATR